MEAFSYSVRIGKDPSKRRKDLITMLYGRLFDIAMLDIFDGRLRTDDELQELSTGAGLKLTRTIGTLFMLRLVEGIPT